MKKYFVFISILCFIACNSYQVILDTGDETAWKVKHIPATPQNLSGDPEKGWNYLLEGDYIGSGIPYSIFKRGENSLRKKYPHNIAGKNTDLPYMVNAFEAYNGAKVVAGNCFGCHGAAVNEELLVTLGNYASDYTKSVAVGNRLARPIVKLKYGKNSKEYEAFDLISSYINALAPNIQLPQIGINPASRLAEACMQHRDPVDLTYREHPLFEVKKYNLASDVPPLWNVKKKNSLYYTGVGRGDFSKLLMQVVVLGIPDSTYARKVQRDFVDVLAWLNTLEAPPYPYQIDEALATMGKPIFEKNCSKCHGTYGTEESYPNKIVSVEVVKTDSLYAAYAMDTKLHEWYNKSWFATSEPKAYMIPSFGYVAPPLDGIWATAPYLHNASVPTLEDLLNSPQRPTYWKRNLDNYDFDAEKVGWNYQNKSNALGKSTFDTTLPGYSNVGHYFGDKLKTEERTAVIEYLKTL